MKKLLTVLILAAVAGGVYFVWRNKLAPNNTWVQDTATGEWARRGSPQGVPPRAAIEDCYQQAAGRTYDAILKKCLAQLCGSEPVCINGTLDVFSVLRGAGMPSSGEETLTGEELPAAAPPPTTLPASTSSDEVVPALPAPVAESVPTTTPEVSAPEPSLVPPSAPSTSPHADTSTPVLRVSQPAPLSSLTSPFTISGEAQEEVTALVVRVKGADGRTLIQEKVVPRAAAVQGWRPFKLTLAYSFSRTKSGTVEVVPEGGDDKTAVVIPVEFK